MAQVDAALSQPRPATPEHLEIQARFFKMLGDESRLRIIAHLLDGEKNVGELVDLLEVSQSRVSNHLACLRWCGFVTTRKEGRAVYYRVIDPKVADLLELSRGVITDNAEYILSCSRI